MAKCIWAFVCMDMYCEVCTYVSNLRGTHCVRISSARSTNDFFPPNAVECEVMREVPRAMWVCTRKEPDQLFVNKKSPRNIATRESALSFDSQTGSPQVLITMATHMTFTRICPSLPSQYKGRVSCFSRSPGWAAWEDRAPRMGRRRRGEAHRSLSPSRALRARAGDSPIKKLLGPVFSVKTNVVNFLVPPGGREARRWQGRTCTVIRSSIITRRWMMHIKQIPGVSGRELFSDGCVILGIIYRIIPLLSGILLLCFLFHHAPYPDLQRLRMQACVLSFCLLLSASGRAPPTSKYLG